MLQPLTHSFNVLNVQRPQLIPTPSPPDPHGYWCSSVTVCRRGIHVVTIIYRKNVPTCVWADVPFVWVGRMFATSVWAVQYVISMLCSTEVFVQVVCLRRYTYYDASFWTTITECFPPTKRAFWKCCPKLIHWKCQFCLLMRFVERQNWAFWKMFKCGCQYFLTWSYSLQQCSLIA